MTSIGTGYDLSASTYSPDGRIFQVSPHKTLVFTSSWLISVHSPGRVRKQGSRELWVSHFPPSLASTGLVRMTERFKFRTAIGLRVKDGIVLAVEKVIHSKLLMPESNKRILTIDRNIGFVRFFHATVENRDSYWCGS